MENQVAIERCLTYSINDVMRAVEKSLASFGGMNAFIKNRDKVIIKPNLLTKKAAEKAVTTHPSVVEAVAKMALDCGAQVTIADSPPIYSAQTVTDGCGIGDVARRLGIDVLNLKNPTAKSRREQKLTSGVKTPFLSEYLLDADVIINVPKLKAHCQMLMTCAVKNLYGCVVARRKAFWHFKLRHSPDDFAAMLLGLMERVSPELTIVDGITAMQGMGPTNGTPIDIGLILAGKNPIAIDRVVSEIVNVPVHQHFVLRTAQQYHFPYVDLNEIETIGEDIDDVKVKDFQLPDMMMPIGFSITHLIKGLVKYAAKKFSTKQSPETA